jgi:hypothetical protein
MKPVHLKQNLQLKNIPKAFETLNKMDIVEDKEVLLQFHGKQLMSRKV